MIIHVKVKANSSQQKIEKFSEDRYLIYLKSDPEHNKANMELIRILSKHFYVSSAQVKIKTGLNNRNKIIEITKDEV